jgi:hypothetical protein
MMANGRSDEEPEMSPERAHAYRQVMHTLSDVGPSKLLDAEQARIRDAADELIFSRDADDARTRAARADIESLCSALVESGRWEQTSADRLAAAVYGCGPALPLHAQAA